MGEDQAVFITFQVPGSTNTSPASINNAGSVAGYYATATDPYQTFHGFLRDARGAITTFDVSGSNVRDTFPTSINEAGAITGSYGPAGGQQPHGFVRDPSGVITLFGAPNSIQTFPRAINERIGLISPNEAKRAAWHVSLGG